MFWRFSLLRKWTGSDAFCVNGSLKNRVKSMSSDSHLDRKKECRLLSFI